MNFALFTALDDLGDVEAAFPALRLGNDLRRARLRHDPQALCDRFRAIMQIAAPVADTPPAPGDPHPIFVTGLPRSGTTLTERMLGQIEGVAAAGELPVVPAAMSDLFRDRPLSREVSADEMAALAQAIRAGLRDYAQGAPVIIDKLPANACWIDMLLRALPEARVIAARRDPMAVGWSLYQQYFGSDGLDYAYGFDTIANYMRLHEGIMQEWRTRWSARLIDLDYARLVAAPEAETRRLADLCDLRWTEDCIRPEKAAGQVLTNSAHQVRRGLYTGSDDKWRRYAAPLEPLRQMLDGLGAVTPL